MYNIQPEQLSFIQRIDNFQKERDRHSNKLNPTKELKSSN